MAGSIILFIPSPRGKEDNTVKALGLSFWRG
jgi:hypothetical protein